MIYGLGQDLVKKRLKELLLKHFKENMDYSFALPSE